MFGCDWSTYFFSCLVVKLSPLAWSDHSSLYIDMWLRQSQTYINSYHMYSCRPLSLNMDQYRIRPHLKHKEIISFHTVWPEMRQFVLMNRILLCKVMIPFRKVPTVNIENHTYTGVNTSQQSESFETRMCVLPLLFSSVQIMLQMINVVISTNK